MSVDWNEDVDAARKIIRESKANIESQPGQSHGFHISQADIARYGATSSCHGCKFAVGKVTYQRGHSTECRKRIMKLMREDPDDRFRVEAWEVNHGFEEEKDVQDEGLAPEGSNMAEENNNTGEIRVDAKIEEPADMRLRSTIKRKGRGDDEEEERFLKKIERESGIPRYQDTSQAA